MSKLRSDSKWNALTAEQRETLEAWLFEENLAFREALKRAQEEFAITASLGSLAEFYKHLARERWRRELRETAETSEEIGKTKVRSSELVRTAMTAVANRMVQLAVESPGKVRELVSLGRLLMTNEGLEIDRLRFELEDLRMEAAMEEHGRKRTEKVRLQTMFLEAIAASPKAAGSPPPPAGERPR